MSAFSGDVSNNVEDILLCLKILDHQTYQTLPVRDPLLTRLKKMKKLRKMTKILYLLRTDRLFL